MPLRASAPTVVKGASKPTTRFDDFDSDEDGCISAAEFRQGLNEEEWDTDVIELFQQADLD